MRSIFPFFLFFFSAVSDPTDPFGSISVGAVLRKRQFTKPVLKELHHQRTFFKNNTDPFNMIISRVFKSILKVSHQVPGKSLGNLLLIFSQHVYGISDMVISSIIKIYHHSQVPIMVSLKPSLGDTSGTRKSLSS